MIYSSCTDCGVRIQIDSPDDDSICEECLDDSWNNDSVEAMDSATLQSIFEAK